MKFAAIDIGSNAVRLLLARVIEESGEPLFKKEVLVRMPLRLGDDTFRTGMISEEKSKRLVETMIGFRHLIAAYPALDFAAYATSAMREAKNAREVVARVRKASDVAIEVIEGAREAEVIYANHIEQTDLQLSREPLPLPTMKLNPEVKDLFAFRFEDFELVGYQAHPHIKAPVAV